jgi:hypothetical protein
MPFSQPTGAYWLLIGPDIELRRTVYDFTNAAKRIREAGFPKLKSCPCDTSSSPQQKQKALNFSARPN